jgi:uncharacterized membrane protein
MSTTSKKPVVRRLLGVLFTGAGLAHFTNPSFFTSLVPERLVKYRNEINTGTGIYQTAGGLAFFTPKARQLARWSALSILIPTLPAAIQQVREPERMRALGVPPQLTPVRVVVQVLMTALVWWATSVDTPTPSHGATAADAVTTHH